DPRGEVRSRGPGEGLQLCVGGAGEQREADRVWLGVWGRTRGVNLGYDGQRRDSHWLAPWGRPLTVGVVTGWSSIDASRALACLVVTLSCTASWPWVIRVPLSARCLRATSVARSSSAGSTSGSASCAGACAVTEGSVEAAGNVGALVVGVAGRGRVGRLGRGGLGGRGGPGLGVGVGGVPGGPGARGRGRA